jgi:hypothetical protein
MIIYCAILILFKSESYPELPPETENISSHLGLVSIRRIPSNVLFSFSKNEAYQQLLTEDGEGGRSFALVSVS